MSEVAWRNEVLAAATGPICLEEIQSQESKWGKERDRRTLARLGVGASGDNNDLLVEEASPDPPWTGHLFWGPRAGVYREAWGLAAGPPNKVSQPAVPRGRSHH